MKFHFFIKTHNFHVASSETTSAGEMQNYAMQCIIKQLQYSTACLLIVIGWITMLDKSILISITSPAFFTRKIFYKQNMIECSVI